MHCGVNMAVLGEVGIMPLKETRIIHVQMHKNHARFAFPPMSYGFAKVITW